MKILSSEHRKKISMTMKARGYRPKNNGQWIGKKHTEEAKRKMSEAKKGKPSSKKGIPLSIEQRKKISESLRGKTGVLSRNWKGGKTPLMLLIRNSYKTRQWRSDIFTRDNFTCVLCFKRGTYIEADHYPKMFSSIFYEKNLKTLEDALSCEELWNINNGRTLCRPCHDKTKTNFRVNPQAK